MCHQWTLSLGFSFSPALKNKIYRYLNYLYSNEKSFILFDLTAEISKTPFFGSRCQSPIFLPGVQGQKQCTFNHHCRNVDCIVSSEGHNLTLGMKLKKCHEPPSVTVMLKQAQDNGNLNWSHSLKDGDKIKVPTSGESFSGGLPVTESAIYVQVGLKKINGSHINYTVRSHSTTLCTYKKY